MMSRLFSLQLAGEHLVVGARAQERTPIREGIAGLCTVEARALVQW